MVDVLKQVDMTNILHRLLAEEREKIAEFIHASHMTLASHFEHDVALLCEGTGQNLLAPSADYSVAGSFLHGNFVNCGKVEAPLADAALPDTLALGNNSPNGETLNGTRVIAETLNGNHRNEQSAPEKAAPSDFHAHSGSGGLSHTVKRISNLQMTSVGKPNIRNGRSEATVGRLRRIVDSAMFELVFAFLIFFNAICMAMEQQYIGLETAYKLQLPGSRSANVSWPNAELSFVVSEQIFGVIFALEVILKIFVFRREFPKSFWNVYDTVMVLCWVIESTRVLSLMDPRVLRLAKMMRLMRLLRFAKAFQVFDVLHLLVHSMLACMTALMWSAVLLFLVMMGTALVMIYVIHDVFEDEVVPHDERTLLYTYFGNFTNGMFSMFELTMGNWVPISRAVVRNLGDWYMLFFIVYRTVVGFAVLRVVTAIFTAETFRVAQSDDGIMLMEKERQIRTHTTRMQQLLSEGDESQDGYLSLDEFNDLLADNRVRKWLSAQDIEVKDVALAYRLIDDSGDGRVSTEELVRGFMRLKGTAKSIDMLTVIHAFSKVEDLLGRLDADLHARTVVQSVVKGHRRPSQRTH
eukprot:TRINITY_DN14806_c0_g1_i1.p1 TRINITY_DN14806_c0_g1~~TRINITY_DN14806_c0_g1_i1.p1  ORF type:complete len:579 (+),score=59.43 TRINITY_DN14806_c0_g1_i1:180-1916(+)